jgi:hypothetical protein
MTEVEKARIERAALQAYYQRDAEALRRLIQKLLALLDDQPRKETP